jgi:protein-S-isoprenylcysteine O-methyltransferase Ste14
MRYVFEIIWICWFLSEILLNRIFRSKKTDSKNFDKNSLRLIWLTIIISITLGVLSKSYLNCPISETSWLRYFGLLIIVAGMILRFIAIKTLGKFFTVDLSIHDSHKLISKGLYKYIRHPAYAGSLLSFFGFALSLNNWISLIIIFVPVLSSFIYRINIEEKMLIEELGLKYNDYKKNTKRLIPMIY